MAGAFVSSSPGGFHDPRPFTVKWARRPSGEAAESSSPERGYEALPNGDPADAARDFGGLGTKSRDFGKNNKLAPDFFSVSVPCP